MEFIPFNTLQYKCFLLICSVTLLYVLGIQLIYLDITTMDMATVINTKVSSLLAVRTLSNPRDRRNDSMRKNGDSRRLLDDKLRVKRALQKSLNDKRHGTREEMKTVRIHANASQFEINQFHRWAITTQRRLLKDELKDYNFPGNTTLQDYVLETRGHPIRSVIFSMWRSGSNFLGEIIENHPGTFYHFESLAAFSNNTPIRDATKATTSIRLLRDVLNCDYSHVGTYFQQMWHSKTHYRLWYGQNRRVWKYCKDYHQDKCLDPTWLSNMCKLFPFQVLKTVRLKLKLARSLLIDPKLNIRLLLLVRDPRDTILSRMRLKWCTTTPDCGNAAILCSDLVQNFYEAQKLQEEYPTRFMVLHYEDLASNMHKVVQRMYDFLRLEYMAKTKTFLKYRTNIRRPYQWIKHTKGNSELIQAIQDTCEAAITFWGYKLLEPKDFIL